MAKKTYYLDDIKTEYITGNDSLRQLSKKHNIAAAVLFNRSKSEDWVGLRRQFKSDKCAKAVETALSSQTQRVERIHTIADKIIDKLEAAVDQMTEDDLALFRQATAILKDIKDVQMLKSERDIVEQEARIDKLKKEAREEEHDNTIVVKIDNGEEYAV